MIVGLIAYVVSRMCVLAAAGVRASQMVVDSRKLARLEGIHAAGAERGPHDRRGADVVGRPVVPRHHPARLPEFDPAEHHLQPGRGTSGVLPRVSVARPCRSTWCSPAATPSPPSSLNFVLGAVAVRAGRPPRPGAVRRTRRVAGDGVVRRVPRQLRAVVHVLRGDPDRARCRLPAVPPPRAVVARRHRRRCSARPRDPTVWRSWRPARSPASWRSAGPAPGARSWRWCWRRSASSSSSCTSTTRPASGARGSASSARPGRRGRATAPPRCRTPLDFFIHPLSSPTDALTALSMIALVAMVWCAWKVRLASRAGLVLCGRRRPDAGDPDRHGPPAIPDHRVPAASSPSPPGGRERRRRADGAGSDGDDDRLNWASTGWDMTLVLGGAGIAVLTGLYAVFGAIP